MQRQPLGERRPAGRSRDEHREVGREGARVVERAGGDLDDVVVGRVVDAVDLGIDEQGAAAGGAEGAPDRGAAVGDHRVARGLPLLEDERRARAADDEHLVGAGEALAVAAAAHVLEGRRLGEGVADRPAPAAPRDRFGHIVPSPRSVAPALTLPSPSGANLPHV